MKNWLESAGRIAIVSGASLAGAIVGTSLADAMRRPNVTSPDYNKYAAGRLDGKVKTNGYDRIARDAEVAGSSDFTKNALDEVGGVFVHPIHSTRSAVIGIAPEGAVFEEVLYDGSMIGAKCDLPQIKLDHETIALYGAQTPVVCWMSADYFKSKDIPSK